MTFHLTTFVLELLNFLVLAYVLHRLLYRPLHEAIDRRRQAHAQAAEKASQALAQAEQLKQQLQAQLADIDHQREDVLRNTHLQIEIERKRLIGESEQLVTLRQNEARVALDRERREMLNSVREDIIRESITLTQRLLHQAADTSIHTQLILKLVETVESLTQEERDALFRNWRKQDGVFLESAMKLEQEAQLRLQKTICDLLGPDAELNVSIQAALIAGAKLRVAGQVWDATLAGQLVDIQVHPTTEIVDARSN